jgi:hypothetical protein
LAANACDQPERAAASAFGLLGKSAAGVGAAMFAKVVDVCVDLDVVCGGWVVEMLQQAIPHAPILETLLRQVSDLKIQN